MKLMLTHGLEMREMIYVLLLLVLSFGGLLAVQCTGFRFLELSSTSGDVGTFVKSVTSLWCGLS